MSAPKPQVKPAAQYSTTTGRPVLLRILIPFGALYLAYKYTAKQAQQAPDASPAADPAAGGRRSPHRADPAAPGATAPLAARHEQAGVAS
jgi:hypothetical protein